MLYYYKYDFISPESIYATIKEELKAYFESGAVDDFMFPKWTDLCLKKLGKVAYSVKSTVLHIDTFKAKLPSDFYKVREASICIPGKSVQYTHPSAEYRECVSSAIKLDDNIDPRCND